MFDGQTCKGLRFCTHTNWDVKEQQSAILKETRWKPCTLLNPCCWIKNETVKSTSYSATSLHGILPKPRWCPALLLFLDARKLPYGENGSTAFNKDYPTVKLQLKLWTTFSLICIINFGECELKFSNFRRTIFREFHHMNIIINVLISSLFKKNTPQNSVYCWLHEMQRRSAWRPLFPASNNEHNAIKNIF